MATCHAQGLTTTYAVDEEIPQQGDGFFYLVGRISGGEHGPLGFASDGQARVLYDYCD